MAPELPEVETTVRGLSRVLPGLSITDVWTNLNSRDIRGKGSVKEPVYFRKFKKQIKGKKFVNVERRAKNILVHLSDGYTILIHMKMTGHLLYGEYVFNKKKNEWTPSPKEKNTALRDPFNRHIRIIFSLSNGKHLALSDVRKFAKVVLIPIKELHTSKHLEKLGPEPLEKNFTEKVFAQRLLRFPLRPIKQTLLDQSVISGIGNIYSDEMLWLAGIHPLSKTGKITTPLQKKLFAAMKKVLAQGIDFGGDSTSDYRDIYGNRGTFQHAHNAYRLTGTRCKKKGCTGTIKRIVVGGRSAHFCSKHQKLLR